MSELEPRRAQPEKVRRQCSRTMKTGERCKKAPILGGTVCSKHGGRAPHIKAAAKARLENAADRLAKQLLGMAEDPKMPPAVKLAALKDALDRAGMSPRQALEVSHELKPYESIMEKLSRIPDPGPASGPIIVDGKVIYDDRFGDDSPPDTVDPYADNPLQADGFVHCQECGYHFADLDRLHAHGLTKYARLCADCREAARAEKAAERELDAEIGAPTGSRPPPDPLQARRGRPTEAPDRTPGRNPRYPLHDPRY